MTPSPTEVALAGLLHDIGKLVQRAHGTEQAMPEAVRRREGIVLPHDRHGRYTHRHALWSDAFFEWTDAERLDWPADVDHRRVRDMAVFHHKPAEPAHWLVTEADRLSAGMDRKARDEAAEENVAQQPRARDEYRRVALRSTVASVRIGLGEPPTWAAFGALPLDAEALVPAQLDRDGQPARYEALWSAFQDGYRTLAGIRPLPAERFEQGLLGLSERLLWAVPSSTVDQPDISLHDHARSVAAIAACLAAYHEAAGDAGDLAAIQDRARPKFRLVELDLAGIQRALLRLQSQQVQGAARILRARSFLIGATVDAAVLWLRQALGLPASCVLQAAGGRARLLAPHLPGLDHRLAGLRDAADRWCAEYWHGDLALHVAAGPAFGGKGLLPDELPRTEAEAAAALEAAKQQPLRGFGTGILHAPFGADGQCATCGARPAVKQDRWEPDVRRCVPCDQAHRLGRILPKTDGIALLGTGAGARGEAELFGRFLLTAEPLERPSQSLAEASLDRDSAAAAASRAATWRPAAWVPVLEDPDARRYAGIEDPVEAGGLKTFAHIAADALEALEDGRLAGRALLAVVKADVDRLGIVFGHGLGRRRTPAGTAQLSRLMDAYFGVRLPAVLKRCFPTAYTVYAGGDDLLIVAPWRHGPGLALALREDFGRFAAGNPNLSLSAGIAFVHPDQPLNRAVEEADGLLDAAKDAGRDRAGLLGRALAWGRLERTLDLADALVGHLRAGDIGGTALHQASRFARERARAEAGDATAAGWCARWSYYRHRLEERVGTARAGALRPTLDRLLPPPMHLADADAEIALTFALWRDR